MIETLTGSKEFEQKPSHETEQKFVPVFPERLAAIRQEALPIEQFYLSHPDEEFSLRLREAVDQDGQLQYTATLKDKGQLTPEGRLERLEVETAVTAQMYAYYKTSDVPVLRKLRATPYKNVVVDFFEDGYVHAESEHPLSWVAFCDQQDLTGQFVDVTGDRQADSQWRAHLVYRREHNGAEILTPSQELSVETIVHDILSSNPKTSPIVLRIGGRSGSGKTTLVRELQDQLQGYGLDSTVLSTDDYHRGKTWLDDYKGAPWTEWDAPIVYDTAALAKDLDRLKQGGSVEGRRFDFTTQEPVSTGPLQAVPVVIIEGIYARSPDLDTTVHLGYEVPTPLATCVGRRLLRDMRERPQFADPVGSLRYMLEMAEPAYRAQEV